MRLTENFIMAGTTPSWESDSCSWMGGLSSWLFTGKFKIIKALEH